MTKLLVLDKDGTLTRPKSGNTFVQHPEDQELIEGVAEAIQRYIADGWTIAIASNQGGVAAGYKSLGDAIAEVRYAMKLIGIQYHGLLCPDFNGDECYIVSDFSAPPLHKVEHYKSLVGSFRKPQGGMLTALWRHFSTHESEITASLMIGDRPEDQGAAQAAGFDFMWAEDWRKSN